MLPIEVFQQELPSIQSLLQELVEIETPSTDKAAVDRLGKRIQRELQALGGAIEIVPQSLVGDQILCRWGTGPDGILVLCHMDTVFDLGMLARHPFRSVEGRLEGPGVQDMKGGIAMLLSVLRLLRQHGEWPKRPLVALFTSDEETGSQASRTLIETAARQSGLALCLEPALANGALKTSRKGTGEIELNVKGVAAHAGVDHARGRNAIEELAYHILEAQKLSDAARGTTVNVGMISGGTRPNVVPDQAQALIDFRILSGEEYTRLEHWVNDLSPRITGTSLSASISLNRPPMPRDDTMVHTFQKARAIGLKIGLDPQEGSTGGGSDANFVAPLGVPVLDGLGAVGDGAHTEREYILAQSLVERSALLAALLLNW
jgi:glutamate carboxypeptidase